MENEVRNPTVESLRSALAELGISSKGNCKTLKERLRKAKKKREGMTQKSDDEVASASGCSESQSSSKQPFDFYCVLDVEATCQEDNKGWQHEIIEFPVILLNGSTKEIIAEFRSFVRPVLNPVLSDFCVQLTGIQQKDVDEAPAFPEVLRNFEAFLSSHQVKHSRMRFITDGPWDIRNFIAAQCQLSQIRLPAYFGEYIDLRRKYTKFRGRKNGGKRANLMDMLSSFGLEFEGRQHSGIDDTRNITRIAIKMMEAGCVFDKSI